MGGGGGAGGGRVVFNDQVKLSFASARSFMAWSPTNDILNFRSSGRGKRKTSFRGGTSHEKRIAKRGKRSRPIRDSSQEFYQ